MQSYDEQVAEDLKVGREVMRMIAYDIDDGDNSRLTYELSPSSEQFNEYFRIDANTGVVYLKKTLDVRKTVKNINILFCYLFSSNLIGILYFPESRQRL